MTDETTPQDSAAMSPASTGSVAGTPDGPASVSLRAGSEWRVVVEGMKFADKPVQDMTADQLLHVVGYLAMENRRLRRQKDGALRILGIGDDEENPLLFGW